ncbi:WD repeat protein 26 [Pyricularia oryzae Y34]|uniref:WD repeat protein 26 n=1 Tax=Pyricularia oryzae (strain Y34) TaxID=1143189 RepID=A0AA97NXL1_PYRO3|nr:WD repeat protein 26 [Pyricularia oryzae Y34]
MAYMLDTCSKYKQPSQKHGGVKTEGCCQICSDSSYLLSTKPKTLGKGGACAVDPTGIVDQACPLRSNQAPTFMYSQVGSVDYFAGASPRTPIAEVADQTSRSDAIYPDASDSPVTVRPSSGPARALSSSTALEIAESNVPGLLTLAPTPTFSPSSNPTQQDTIVRNFPEPSQPPSTTPLQTQVLGRRRRGSSSGDEEGEGRAVSSISLAGVSSGSLATTESALQRRQGKRMRRDSMLADDSRILNPGQSSSIASNGNSSLQSRAATTNGTHKMMAGAGPSSTSSYNGRDVVRPPSGDYLGHDREEVTRILIQALSEMGYQDAAESVSRHSGYHLESRAVAEFRTAVLDGDWPEAERLLFSAVQQTSKSGKVSSGNGLILAPGADKALMQFWLRQQKFLELLEQRETGRALAVLRNELTPLYQDTPKLHFLSGLLMCRTPEDLRAKAEWDGTHGKSRHILLSELSRCISPSVMLPEHRLAVLLSQVKDDQILNCIYHTSATSPSLYCDHYCDREKFPSQVIQELSSGAGEIWQIQFSHDGTKLASSGSDESVIIWSLSPPRILHTLGGHQTGVGNIAWSPDDSMLITCGRDRYARFWDTRTGTLIRKLEQFEEPVSSCIWAADGQSVILGSFDRERSLCQWDLDGARVCTWTKKHRTEDVAVSPDGRWLVAMDEQSKIHVYNFITREVEYEFEVKPRPCSIAISQDSRLLLANSNDGAVQLFDLLSGGLRLQQYLGCTGGAFLIRCEFGGANESFVASGSEGHLICRLHAHHPRCNAVRWNPKDPCMFATCGDDGKIKIWGNSEHNLRSHSPNGSAA